MIEVYSKNHPNIGACRAIHFRHNGADVQGVRTREGWVFDFSEGQRRTQRVAASYSESAVPWFADYELARHRWEAANALRRTQLAELKRRRPDLFERRECDPALAAAVVASSFGKRTHRRGWCAL